MNKLAKRERKRGKNVCVIDCDALKNSLLRNRLFFRIFPVVVAAVFIPFLIWSLLFGDSRSAEECCASAPAFSFPTRPRLPVSISRGCNGNETDQCNQYTAAELSARTDERDNPRGRAVQHFVCFQPTKFTFL